MFKEFLGTDKLAAGLALCTLLMLFVFFYALQQNVTGLGKEIEELRNLNGAVLELNARHATLDGKVTELNTLPRRTTAMALENQVKTMAHATADLDQRLDGKHRDKLQVIQTLLQEIGDDLHNAK